MDVATHPPSGGDVSARRASVDPLVRLTSGLEVVLEATRRLLWIRTPEDAAACAHGLVAGLGGSTASADHWSPDAVPVDISFGVGRPVVPVAASTSVSRILLETHLPTFMLDAQRALELADITVRLTEDASIDILTGLANRRTLDRLLARLAPVDTVVMIDLDHFKHVNDSLGHPEGDRVLRTLGRTLTAALRASDHAGRFGGEEFVVILRDGDEPEPFLTRLSRAWATARPHPITFSAGVAAAGPDPRHALQAADRALYRAKAAGRDQWQHAVPEDYL